jgi:endonuclease/exonuclease/phosphatase family metal-dependent hydrolase
MAHLKPGLSRSILAATIATLAACTAVRPSPTADRPSSPITVLVYNVHAGKDAAGRDNLQRVADVVTSSGADIVLLQEVDKGTRRSGGVDQPSEYAKRTGLTVAFGRSLNYDGGEYGIALLSRWPIRRDTAIHLVVTPPQERSGGSYEPRVAHRAIVAAPGGDIVVLNTHIDASADDRWRRQEVRALNAILREITASGARRVLFGGDLNSTPESAVQAELRNAGHVDAWQRCGRGPELTYPADSGVKRIDYLYLVAGAECSEARVIDTQASDHRPVLFVLRM